MEKKSNGKKAEPEKAATKTYGSLMALMKAKVDGALPRGVKVEIGDFDVEWKAKGETIFEMSVNDFAKAKIKDDGFAIA